MSELGQLQEQVTRLVARAEQSERAFTEYLQRGDCPAKPFLVPGTDDGVSAQYVMVLTTPAIALVEDLNAKLEKANFDRKQAENIEEELIAENEFLLGKIQEIVRSSSKCVKQVLDYMRPFHRAVKPKGE